MNVTATQGKKMYSPVSLFICLLSVCLISTVSAAGPFLPNVVRVSSNYTVGGTDVIIMVDSTTAPVWIFLPAVSAATGRTVSIMDEGEASLTNFITVTCAGSDIISRNSGMNIFTIVGSAGVQMISNGVDKWMHWEIF